MEHEAYYFEGNATYCSCGDMIAATGEGPEVYQAWLDHRKNFQ